MRVSQYLAHTRGVLIGLQNRWLYPFDAEADTLQRWQEVSAQVSEELAKGKIKPLFSGSASQIVV